MPNIRVLVADDHKIVREGLCALLAEEPDLDVVGQASDGLEAIHLARELRVDVVVMDIGMQPVNGIEATRRVLKDCPDTRVLILSQYEDAESVLHAIEAGALGYVMKRSAGADLADAIRAVYQGAAALHPLAAHALIDAYLGCEASRHGDSHAILTDREREILILVAEGYTNQQIADTLHVSAKTVDTHRTSVMSKLNLHNRTDLVKYALRNQLIDL